MREDYFGPVGFAKEPVEVRRRWIGRALSAIFVVLLVLLLWFKVIKPPPSDNPTFNQNPPQNVLPS
jgi:hypothetical protein